MSENGINPCEAAANAYPPAYEANYRATDAEIIQPGDINVERTRKAVRTRDSRRNDAP